VNSGIRKLLKPAASRDQLIQHIKISLCRQPECEANRYLIQPIRRRRLQPGEAARTPLPGAERKPSEPAEILADRAVLAAPAGNPQRISPFVAEILGFSVLRAANLQRICCENSLQLRCERSVQRRGIAEMDRAPRGS